MGSRGEMSFNFRHLENNHKEFWVVVSPSTKFTKSVENSQELMAKRVDLNLWMFLSRFLHFCRTQLQKLRILKIHFNLTLLLLLFFLIFT